MSTHRTTTVFAELPAGGIGWIYSINDLENFLKECRAVGLKPTHRIIRATTTGQLVAKFDDSMLVKGEDVER